MFLYGVVDADRVAMFPVAALYVGANVPIHGTRRLMITHSLQWNYFMHDRGGCTAIQRRPRVGPECCS